MIHYSKLYINIYMRPLATLLKNYIYFFKELYFICQASWLTVVFIRMKSKAQSHQFPEYMSDYYKDKEMNEDTL
jgi:hypothetical protein